MPSAEPVEAAAEQAGEKQAELRSPIPEASSEGSAIRSSTVLRLLARVRPEHSGMAALLAGVFLFANFLPLWHTDIWGHLKFGRWIVAHGRLPSHEPFCAAADKSAPYINFQWLSQAGFYLVYRLGELLSGGNELDRTAGGVELLRALHALLITLRSALLLTAVRSWTGSWRWGSAAVGLSLLLGIANVGVLRPQVAAEVLFAALLAFLSRPRLDRRGIAAIAGIMVLWANTHGSYPVGLTLLAGWTAGLAVENRLGWSPRRTSIATLRALLAALVLSVLGSAALNPHGPALFVHTLALARHPNIADMDEWKSLAWDTPWGVAFIASLGLLAALFVWQFAVPSRRTHGASCLLPQLVLLAGFGAQTYLHQRFMPWWVLLVPWILLTRFGAAARRGDNSVPCDGAPTRAGLVPVHAMLCGAILFATWSLSGPGQWLRDGRPRPLDQAVHSATPWRLACELKAQCSAGRSRGTVFATETLGDYLLWALPPEAPVLLYTHVHLFSPEHWKLCQRVKAGAPDCCSLLDAYHARVVVCEAELHPWLCERIRTHGGWRVVLDETGHTMKPDVKGRLFVAIRSDAE